MLGNQPDDVKKLHETLGTAERDKLGYYLDAVESMGNRQAELAAAAERIARLGRSRDARDFPVGAGGFAHLDAQFDIAATALVAPKIA